MTLAALYMTLRRRFGTSRRFAESDKKEMAELIAVRLQIADDERRQDTVKLVERLDEAGKMAEQRERTARRVDGAIRDFVRRHEKELVRYRPRPCTAGRAISEVAAVRSPAVPLSRCDPRQVFHTHG